MRVYDTNPAATSAAESGRSQETAKISKDHASPSAGTRSPGSEDRVELSSMLGRLSQALSDMGSQRSARVHALAGQYQSGQYRPDSMAIAHGLISEALASGPE